MTGVQTCALPIFLAGTGYYMQDSKLRYSDGVKTMQEKLTTAGYDCGIPDGRFGSETTSAIRRLQWFNELDINGRADKSTLVVLEAILNGSVTPPSGEYSVNFDNINKRFDTNQQIVYEALAEAGLGKIAIAGIMGNIEAESGFDTTWSDTGGAGICQWDDRKGKLEAYAASISGSITDIHVQTQFILEECTSSSDYKDGSAVNCFNLLKDTSTVDTVRKATDYFTALYERCEFYTSWTDVENSGYDLNRFSPETNAYNQRYYLDAPKRRGYANSYYTCLLQM